MKTVETYKGSGERVAALQDSDMARMAESFQQIEREWYSEWVARGCIDEGSCIMGVGISVYYLPPRARTPQRRQVIRWNGSQGDFEAERTKGTPIGRLAEMGVQAFYDCGWMD
jgi:hypothetical protein